MKTFVTILILVLVAILGVGFYQGWFEVDQSEAKQDLNQVQEQGEELVEESGEALQNMSGENHQDAMGTVQNVNANENQITIMTQDNQEMTFGLINGATITRQDKEIQLGELKSGEQVKITYYPKKKGEMPKAEEIHAQQS